jgi:hypothetical protein
VAFSALLLLARAAEQKSARHAFLAAVLTAGLPMIHMHSFLAVGLAAAVWLVVWRVKNRSVAIAWLLPLLVAIPQLLRTRQQLAQSAGSFIRMKPGWMSPEGGLAVQAKFWLMNGGLLVPLAMLAFALAPTRLKKLTAPFLLLFALAAMVVFQPNDFDNIKLFAFSVCIFSALCAGLLARLWNRNIAGKIAAVAACLALCGSGLASVIYEWKSSWRIAGPKEIAFANTVRDFTPPDAVILTGKQPTHPAFFLAGRRVFLGFHNWTGQHGMPIEPRRTEVREMFTGSENADMLLKQHALRYVVIGPPEREEFGAALNEQFFKDRAESSASTEDYTIYRLR